MKYGIASMSIAGCIPSTTNPLDNKYNVQRIESAKYHVPITIKYCWVVVENMFCLSHPCLGKSHMLSNVS